MEVSVRPTGHPLVPARAATAPRVLGARAALAVLVGLGFAVRTVLGLFRETPIYLGDEYLYAELGRSLAETGRPLVRGEGADFPALLQPIVTAPAWLADDVGVSYHLVQTIGALAMALAAVPVFWLARRLGLTARVALATAAFALVLPDLVYASWVIAEPIAYPLALGAVAAAVAALSRPEPRIHLAFVALAGLAAFARVQFVVLPICFALAVALVGARERRLVAALREHLLPLGVFGAAGATVLALGPSRALAFYSGVVEVDVDTLAVARHSATNLLVLLYASGFVLVPGALLGLGLAVARPRARAELAFAVVTLLVTAALLVEASIFGDAGQAQERYVFYVLPLAAVAFGLYASRGWPFRLHHALLATGLVALAAVVPLSGFAAANEKMHSPLLYGAFRIEQWLGSPGNGSLAIALGATLAMALVVACSRRPRLATAAGLGLASALAATFAAFALVFDLENTRSARQSFFPDSRSWVDDARLGDVTLVRNAGGQRGAAYQHLFWNRSVRRLVRMPGATIIDPFRADGVYVARDGRLVAPGGPLTGPLLVDQHAVTMRLRGAREVATAPGFSLYRPEGVPRVSLLFAGRFHDGWLTDAGSVTLWPRPGERRLEGRLVLRLSAPATSAETPVRFSLPNLAHEVRLPPRSAVVISLPVCAPGPWAAAFQAKVTGYAGMRPVSVRASEPRFVPGDGGCEAAPRHAPAAAAQPSV